MVMRDFRRSLEVFHSYNNRNTELEHHFDRQLSRTSPTRNLTPFNPAWINPACLETFSNDSKVPVSHSL